MPEIDIGREFLADAPYPVLMTRAELLRMRELEGDPQAEVLALQARVRALQARAASLRGPVLSASDRSMLETAMARPR